MKKITILLIILSLFVFQVPNNVLGAYSGAENPEIEDLNNEIQLQKRKIKEIEDRQAEYSASISKLQSEKISLEKQLSILDNRVLKAQLDIDNSQAEIEKVKLEIKKVNLAIKDKEELINTEKAYLASILRTLAQQDQGSLIEILLLNDTLNDFFKQIKYLQDANEEVADGVEALKDAKKDLESQRKVLEEKDLTLNKLKDELVKQKEVLLDEQENKVYFVEQTVQSESEFQRLLARAKKEQQDANAEIASIEKEIRKKMSEQGKDKLSNSNGFIWPIPENTITTYFHDPDYPFRYLFEHPAVDIRAAQSTPIKAPASGYVARVKIEGSSYGYIMLIHGDGISTVYGHASKSYVKEDEYVTQGQLIGETGGTPGTTGAGNLTTGPHLHFEVRLDGIPVDPLEYLP
jgi:murein DD-endopeptidase MepM/ murein hydrolase activator NlpD